MRASGGMRFFFSIDRAVSCVGGELGGANTADMRDSAFLPRHFRVDSRTVKPGDVFVAMRGQDDDGHNYIMDAARLGASAVLLECTRRSEWFPRGEELGITMIAVPAPETAMTTLAKTWLAEVSPKVVGITGSVGKTTTREFLRGMLKGRVNVHSAVKSYNTLVGCGMTILSMPGNTDVLLLELGTNHPGEIRELVTNFPITHGAITEIASAHIEGLGSLDGVLKAKMEITESGMLSFLSYNNDNEKLRAAVREWEERLAEGRGIKKIGVGFSPSELSIHGIKQNLAADGVPSLAFRVGWRGREYPCEASVFGKQHAHNIAYALALAVELGVSPDVACESVGALASLPGRGEIHRLRGGGLLLDESYNANPASVSRALKNVLETDLPPGLRRVAILGGMRELGAESAYWHEVVMNRASLFDDIYIIGSEWSVIETRYAALRGRWDTVGRFMDEADIDSLSEAVVLLKGSRFYELEKIIPSLTGRT